MRKLGFALLVVCLLAPAALAQTDVYSFEQSTMSVSEGAGTIQIKIVKTGSAGTDATFFIRRVASSTASTADYSVPQPTSPSFEEPRYSTSKPLPLSIIDDGIYEGNEVLTLQLDPASVPPNATIGEPSRISITIVDNEAASFVSLSSSSYTVNESDGSVPVVVRRTGDTTATTRVELFVTNGTADSSRDFISVQPLLTFNPGETEKTVDIPIQNDPNYEPTESFQVGLRARTGVPVNGAIQSPDTATVTINDDDVPAVIQFSSSAYEVAENAGWIDITVTRSGNLAVTARSTVFTFQLSGANAARAGEDYATTAVNVDFAPNQTSKIVTVPLINDAIYQGDLAFQVRIAAGQASVLGTPSVANVTILDDEPSSIVSFASATFTANESDNVATLELVRTGRTDVSSGVVLEPTTGGTATSADHPPFADRITFQVGETSKTVKIPITNDSIYEGNETLRVRISEPFRARIGSPGTATVTIVDDEQPPPPPPPPPTQAFRWVDGSVNVSEGNMATLTLERTSGTSVATTVQVRTIAGSATAGSDYTPVTTTLSFAAGETTKTVSIATIEDATEEATEELTVRADADTPVDAAVRIIDDDAPSLPRFAVSSTTASERDARTVIVVTRSGNVAGSDTVTLSTSGGSAEANADYVPFVTSLTFAPNERRREVDLSILQDNRAEPAETVGLTLQTGRGTESGSVTIEDDDVPAARSLTYRTIGANALTIEIFTQSSASGGPSPTAPLLVAFSVDGEMPDAVRLLDRGYPVAVVHVRNLPHPEPFNDALAAIEWLRMHASETGVDTTRLVAWGKGLGGYLAAHLATADVVQAAIVWAAPSDLTTFASDSVCGADALLAFSILGCTPAACPSQAADANPARNASADDPPVLVMHGEADCTVPVQQSRRLAQALGSAGIAVTLRTYAGVGHDDPFWSSQAALREIESFLAGVAPKAVRRRVTR